MTSDINIPSFCIAFCSKWP